MSDKFEQRAKVISDDHDGDETGREWQVYYIIYETEDEDGRTVYALYKDDGEGNGEGLANFFRRNDAMHILLKLGKLVEYREGQKPLTMDEHARLAEHAELFALVNTLLESNDKDYIRDCIADCNRGRLRGPINLQNLHLFRRYRNKVTPNSAILIEEAKQARKHEEA